MLPLIFTALSCLWGAGTFYWLWTGPDWALVHDMPWAPEPEDAIDFTVSPTHDLTGMVY